MSSQQQAMNDRWEGKFSPLRLFNCDRPDNASFLSHKSSYFQECQQPKGQKNSRLENKTLSARVGRGNAKEEKRELKER